MLFEFAEFELDLERYELRRAGRPVRLKPKVFDLLSYLVQHRGRIVGREELLLALWRGEHVNKTAVPWAMSRARKALGQDRPRRRSRLVPLRTRGFPPCVVRADPECAEARAPRHLECAV